jgi:hypothetical protein
MTTPFPELPFDLALVDINQLVAEPFQREVDPRWVDMAEALYEPRALGALVIAPIIDGPLFPEDEGKFSILDGQRRCAVLKRKSVTHWVAIVLEPMTYEERVLMFETYDRRRKLDALDRWRARIQRRDSRTLDAQTILIRHGLIMARKPENPKEFSCAQKVMDIMALGGAAALDWSLGACLQFTPNVSPTRDPLGGFAWVYSMTSPGERRQLLKKLKDDKWTLEALSKRVAEESASASRTNWGAGAKWGARLLAILSGDDDDNSPLAKIDGKPPKRPSGALVTDLAAAATTRIGAS